MSRKTEKVILVYKAKNAVLLSAGRWTFYETITVLSIEIFFCVHLRNLRPHLFNSFRMADFLQVNRVIKVGAIGWVMAFAAQIFSHRGKILTQFRMPFARTMA
jgi:hypothetical protein